MIYKEYTFMKKRSITAKRRLRITILHKKKNTQRRRRRGRQTRYPRRDKKGGDPTTSTTTCCMCEQPTERENTLIPNACLMKYGKFNAHKMCKDCWWSEFAKEGVSHKCPGCVKQLPLDRAADMSPTPAVIDLTEDSNS